MSVVPVATLEPGVDPLLRDYLGLTDAALRGTHSRFIAESTTVVRRALEAGLVPVSFLVDQRHDGVIAEFSAAHPSVPVFVGSSAALEGLTGFHLHRGALASFERPEQPSLRELLAAVESAPASGAPGSGRRRIAILDGLADHTNVGAAFRNAAAFGIDAVLVTATCADPLYRRAIRTSMGTVFQVPWLRIDDWAEAASELASAGFVTAGLTLRDGSITVDQFVAQHHPRVALAFGHEGFGLSAEVEEGVDRHVIIPMMPGVDSLNVAASAAVVFYATR